MGASTMPNSGLPVASASIGVKGEVGLDLRLQRAARVGQRCLGFGQPAELFVGAASGGLGGDGRLQRQPDGGHVGKTDFASPNRL